MRRQLTLLRCLIVRDLRLFISDRRAAVLCFLVPILLGSLFGIVFDQPTRKLGKMKLPLVVIDEDDSPSSRLLIQQLLASSHLEARQLLRTEAVRELESRRVGVAVCFPSGFGQRLKGFSPASLRTEVELLHHPLSSLEAEWAEGVLSEIVLKHLAGEFLRPLGLEKPIELPIKVTRETVPENRGAKFNSYSHSFAGMILQYLLFWGMESGLLLLRERRRGIWNRLRIAPVPLGFLLLSRLLSTTFIGLLQVAITFLFAHFVFGVEITGSWLGFLGLSIGVSFLAAVLGLFVATLSGTEARARNLCILVILIFSMIGGLWLPHFLLPSWVQELSLALPTTWAMRGLDGVTWMASSFAEVLPAMGSVFGFALIGSLVVWFRFARLERDSRRGLNA
jgi:ABC-2 type transport system permease protein